SSDLGVAGEAALERALTALAGDGGDDAGGVDLAHAVVHRVGEVDRAVVGDLQVDRSVEARLHRRAAVARVAGLAGAGDGLDDAVGVDPAQPVVAVIGEDQPALRVVGGPPGRQRVLAGLLRHAHLHAVAAVAAEAGRALLLALLQPAAGGLVGARARDRLLTGGARHVVVDHAAAGDAADDAVLVDLADDLVGLVHDGEVAVRVERDAGRKVERGLQRRTLVAVVVEPVAVA